jgi:hypothetical protein
MVNRSAKSESHSLLLKRISVRWKTNNTFRILVQGENMEIQNQFGIVGHAYRYCFININIPKQAGADGGNFPAAIPSKIPQYRADKTQK